MCGIIAISSRPSTRPVPDAATLLGLLDAALGADEVGEVARITAECDALLHGVPGVQALLGRSELIAAVTARLDRLDDRVRAAETVLERAEAMTPDDIERAGADLIALRDAVWAIRRDRLRTVHAVDDLAGRDAGAATVAGYLAVQQSLSAIDRLEVRGRDSAGLHLFVWHHGLSADDPAVAASIATRAPGCRCWVTPVGPASASSASRTATR
jgi:glucosamine--fructose-6-phosphate aminotransferase (isomerizing)